MTVSSSAASTPFVSWAQRVFTPRRVVALAFVLPALVILLLITIYPLLYTLRLTVVQWELSNARAPIEFVGLNNFGRVLSDARFWNAMRNTGILIGVGVSLELIIGVGLALLLNQVARFRSVLVALFLIPVLIAPVVSGYMFRLILHADVGPLNYLIYLITQGSSRGFGWLSDTHYALMSIMVTTIWQWTPFLMLIALAGLQSIPQEIIESALVDGAADWRIFWSIKLPLIFPVLSVGLLIRIMDTFKTFDLVYLLTSGGPGSATETVAYYTYLKGFRDFSMGYTAAMAFVQLVIIVIIARLILAMQKRQRREDYA